LKTILKQISPIAGEIRWGTKVQIGYYAQQLEDLDDRNEIIMELRRVAPSTATAGELRSFLAKFLFTGDDVYKRVRDLSGGEKGRLALAKLIYSRVNVLVLDEPTNHLDIPSREALEAALDAYEGTIVTISHDRYFLDRVATQILALDGAGVAEHYDGDYTDYHGWKASRLPQAPATETPINTEPLVIPTRSSAGKSTVSSVTSSKLAKTAQKQRVEKQARGVRIVKAKKPATRTQELIEADIANAESKLKAISEQMGQPEVARNPSNLMLLSDEYQQTDTHLRELYEEWERLTTESTSA
jgi:ATP-binding cassette subfamily F protein 3